MTESSYSHCTIAVASSLEGLAASTGSGYGLRPMKYAHRRVTFMAFPKRILKMAQLEPLCSRHGIFAGSFSMVVGVTVGGGDVTVDMGVSLGDAGENREGADRGIKELAGLVVVGRAGPITCREWINWEG